jgi:hypothetical protein
MNSTAEKEVLNERILILTESIRLETELMDADPTNDFKEKIRRKDIISSIVADRDDLILQLKAVEERDAQSSQK